MSVPDLVLPGEHLLITGGSLGLEGRLRETLLGVSEVAYVGREFRAYPSMRIRDAVRFYGAIHTQWDGARLAADLAGLRLGGDFEVRRMKRAYQRALVLALAAATSPSLLVVEGVEEFADSASRAYLARACARAPRSLATMWLLEGDVDGDARLTMPPELGTEIGAQAFEERRRALV